MICECGKIPFEHLVEHHRQLNTTKMGRWRWLDCETVEAALVPMLERVDKCLLWRGPLHRGAIKAEGVPVFRQGAYTVGWKFVRQHILLLVKNPLALKKRLALSCGTYGCVEPTHMTTCARVNGIRKHYAGSILSDADRAAIVNAWRRKAELATEAKAINVIVLGKRFGVSRERICQIIAAHGLPLKGRAIRPMDEVQQVAEVPQ